MIIVFLSKEYTNNEMGTCNNDNREDLISIINLLYILRMLPRVQLNKPLAPLF